MSLAHQQLTALLLLVMVLLAPLISIAHDLKSGEMKAECACHLLHDDCRHDSDSNGFPNDCPYDGLGDCCDHEDCWEDALEPPCASGLTIYSDPSQVFQPYPARTLPKVYLAIFVPPESCCCSLSP